MFINKNTELDYQIKDNSLIFETKNNKILKDT